MEDIKLKVEKSSKTRKKKAPDKRVTGVFKKSSIRKGGLSKTAQREWQER